MKNCRPLKCCQGYEWNTTTNGCEGKAFIFLSDKQNNTCKIDQIKKYFAFIL